MKYFSILVLCALAMTVSVQSYARKHRGRGLPRTEVGLMNNVLGCLEYKDSVNYYDLFVPFDTLWQMVLYNKDKSPEAIQQLNHLKEHPEALIQFDPHYNRKIMEGFFRVLKKGEDSGIHWDKIVMQRYELAKEQITSQNMIGYDKIAPERFKGYMFVRDLLGRLTFCITITEIQKINGYFFGGQVTNILEASDVEDFLQKEKKENDYLVWLAKHPHYDSLIADSLKMDSVKRGLLDTSLAARQRRALLSAGVSDDDDDEKKIRKEVVDRKYYEGKFDNEIPVKLYIRYLRDVKTGHVGYYDGLYKFGDQKSYAKLTITREADGKWLMEDDPTIGTMELVLKDKIYTGSWTNAENGTGYDVILKPADLPEPRMEIMENILERGLSGTVNEDELPLNDSVRSANKDSRPETKEERRARRKAARKREREREEEEDRKNYGD